MTAIGMDTRLGNERYFEMARVLLTSIRWKPEQLQVFRELVRGKAGRPKTARCARNHDRTPANTGAAGECLACTKLRRNAARCVTCTHLGRLHEDSKGACWKKSGDDVCDCERFMEAK